MQSVVVKHSIVIAGHKTSISLEDEFWNGLKQVGKAQKTTLSELVAGIKSQPGRGNLSSAIRIFVLDHFRAQLSELLATGVDAGTAVPKHLQSNRQSDHLNGRSGG
jgi:predicted DNA-binding ribbon-helix-helix protein